MSFRIYNNEIRVIYDPAKNARNLEKHGLHFDDVALLDWGTAIITVDHRKDYGEERLVAFLYKDGKPYHVSFTVQEKGELIRVISFRRAHEKERKRYEKET